MVSLSDALRMSRAYDVWANERVLAAAEQLSPQEFVADRGGGVGSVRNTLVHMLGAQQWLLAVASGNDLGPFPDRAEFPDVASVRAAWATLDAATTAYFATLDDAMLAETTTKPVGMVHERRWDFPRWQILFQLAAHTMQHRSEAAFILTQLGHSPGWIDWIAFLWDQDQVP
jgi:uncharacterized damage-inducible protein DinB